MGKDVVSWSINWIYETLAFPSLYDFTVLRPIIDHLSNPDTINQQVCLHLSLRQMMKRSYAYATSYEDFVSLIEDSDINELHQIR